LQPQSVLAHACRAGGLTLLKRPTEALLAADAALALDQSEVMTWINKGDALERLRRADEALTAFARR
jgi:hypothetical protein